MERSRPLDTRKLVLLALLTAIVVLLQILAIVFRPLFPAFTINLVLMPIIVGAALIGVYAGGWLGLASGFAILLSGDAAPFMVVNPFGTILVVLAKGLLSGLASGAVYKLFEKRNRTVAAIIAAVVCPIVNTGVFIIGTYVFFLPTIEEWGYAFGFDNATAYIFIGMVGVNFLIEFGLNIILCPVIVRLIQYGQDRRIRA
ncbi:MAG: ECF transporter S component [Oscillospiraceae bacterium]|jgi:uncharacterized membrane protein|nr:ECF transporter S component [Oscillospiraceae bacterium]